MKKITTILLTLLLTSVTANAQFKKDSKKIQKKIKSLKIAYITEQLNLTETEAEKFWPIYNKFDEKMMSLRRKERVNFITKIKQAKDFEAIHEEEAKEITIKLIAIDSALYKTKQNRFHKLSKVISYKKILKLEISEKDFHRKLLRKFRGKRKIRK